MLTQNFGVTSKEHYGMLWYFLEWSYFNGLKRHRVSVTGIEHNILCMALTELFPWIVSNPLQYQPRPISAAGLAQSVERLTAEREAADSIPGTGPTLRVLK